MGEPPRAVVEVTHDDDDAQAVEVEDLDPNLAHAQQVIASLRGGGLIDVFRKKPTWCAGYLTTLDLAEGEEIDLAQLKRDWGGGELQLRPKRQTSRGLKYAPGGGTIRLTGAPRENGQPIADTPGPVVIEKTVAPAVRTAAASPGAEFVQLLGMVFQQQTALMQGLLDQARTPAPRGRTEPPPAPAADPFAQLRGFLDLQRQWQELMAPADDDVEPATPSGGVQEKLLEALLRKVDNQPAAPTQQPPPGWRLHKAPASTQTPPANPTTPRSSTTPATPSTNAAATGARLVQQLRELPARERMEVLGELSRELDPDLIAQYLMAEQTRGQVA